MPDDRFILPSLRGREPIRLLGHEGPTLVVNTASLCGFTPQYAGLQALHEDYAGRGLLVVAVPSNDFGRQEPGDEAAIGATCDARRVTFPVAKKAHVRGAAAIPLFRFLAEEAGWLGQPRWNFFKYLLDRDGRFVTWFGSTTKPTSRRVRSAIEGCLGR